MLRGLSLALLAFGLVLPSAISAQSLRGSPASVDRMYRRAVGSGLHFFESAAGVREALHDGVFVRLTGNSDYRLGNVSYAYVLPSTRAFVQRLAADYHSACGERMVITSGVRPRSMRLSNSVSRSVHPTGMAVDLRKPSRPGCLSWLRRRLSEMEGEGSIEATEEHRPPHFHVAVFPRSTSRHSAVTAASAPSSGATTHRVRSGESIWLIARRNGVGVNELERANHLSSARIRPGQLLRIPPRH
jgi:hypothetical protein